MRSYCKHLVITGEHVAAAYQAWTRSQAGRKNLHRVIEEHGSAAALVGEITREIHDRSLTLRPIRRYEHVEPTNGKHRVIGIESVKQQVCDYVAVLAMEDFLHARIGYYQVASVRGKGQLFAARSIRHWAHEGGYWVHLDVRQCYPTISHQVVMAILTKYVRSADILYVARTLLATYGQGLDIGSYFSLRMDQLVLSFGYHHVEGLAKERRGHRHPLVSHQLWYMDDVLLMSPSKRDLRMAARSLERFLQTELGLSLKRWKICRVGEQEPIDMAGFVTRPGRTTIRASIYLRARHAIRHFQHHPTLPGARRVCSYWGWIHHTDSRTAIARNHVTATVRAARLMVSAAERRAA